MNRRSKRRTRSTTNADDGVHPCLHFESTDCTARYNILRHRPIEPNRYLDLDAISALGINDEIVSYLVRGGLYQMAQIREKCCQELFLEFLTTFELDRAAVIWEEPKVMRFRLGNQQWDFSFAEFGVKCGFYSEEFVNSDDYNRALHVLPIEVKPLRVWRELVKSNDLYDPTRSKASSIANNSLRIIHKFIAHSVHGRKESTGVVSKHDLLLLYCMMKGIPVDVGRCFANYIQHMLNSSRGGALCGGSYITNLAINLDVFDTFPRTIVNRMAPINMTTLVNMQLVKKQGGKFVFATNMPIANHVERDDGEKDGEFRPDEIDGQPQRFEGEGTSSSQRSMREIIEEVQQSLIRTELNQRNLERRLVWVENNMKEYFDHMQFTPTPYPSVTPPLSP